MSPEGAMGLPSWVSVVAARGEWWALLVMSICAVVGVEPLAAGVLTIVVAFVGPRWFADIQAWLLASAVERLRLSRTWHGCLPALRHALGRLPAERHAAVLRVTTHEVCMLLEQKRLGRVALKALASEEAFAEPLLAAVHRFFLHTLQMPHVAEAQPPLLPWAIVYHQVAEAANVEAALQHEEGTPRLLPAWKAARLPHEERPPEARDPRRDNERLLLCEGCGEYWQLSGFCRRRRV